MSSHLFSYSQSDLGYIGIGKVPPFFLPKLDIISKEYSSMIPDKTATTYHTYFKDTPPLIHDLFDSIQRDPLWNDLCQDAGCQVRVVPEMNELYYSNPRPGFLKGNLYGSAANLVPHRDCILFHFTCVHFYRAVIGLTDGNEDTWTHFVDYNISHAINRGDYLVFDFDKTVHRVIKQGIKETPRILLKLHYLVCQDCRKEYIFWVVFCYQTYYSWARYTEQIGTDPTTLAGFFWGLLWEYPFTPYFGTVMLIDYGCVLMLLRQIRGIRWTLSKRVLYTVSGMTLIHMSVVFFYWIRFCFTGIR